MSLFSQEIGTNSKSPHEIEKEKQALRKAEAEGENKRRGVAKGNSQSDYNSGKRNKNKKKKGKNSRPSKKQSQQNNRKDENKRYFLLSQKQAFINHPDYKIKKEKVYCFYFIDLAELLADNPRKQRPFFQNGPIDTPGLISSALANTSKISLVDALQDFSEFEILWNISKDNRFLILRVPQKQGKRRRKFNLSDFPSQYGSVYDLPWGITSEELFVPIFKQIKEKTLPSALGMTEALPSANLSPDFIASQAFIDAPGWRELRERFLARLHSEDLFCWNCGKSEDKLHCDHVYPRRKYPLMALQMGNLQILCADCNKNKGNKVMDYRKSICHVEF